MMVRRIVFDVDRAEALRNSIQESRAAIRYHRDQKGDDRCFLDDYIVWARLPDSPMIFTRLPEFSQAMRLCEIFYTFRRADYADPVPPDAITDRSHWDDDLVYLSSVGLFGQFFLLQRAIRIHRDILNRLRTIDDDRALYAVLPEKLPADFRLPSEEAFLGEACAPKAGCPAFWRSHGDCFSCVHNFHEWGPCRLESTKERVA